MEAGGRHHLVLALDADGPAELPEADGVWQVTEEAWRERVPAIEASAAPRESRHAYAVLTGLTSSSGGMVAAATTSLPERAEQGRSYDYRGGGD